MNKKEKVIFLMDVEGIAKQGEIREIGEAFVKNFLLPRQKVLVYSKTVDRQIQHQESKLKEQRILRENEEQRISANLKEKKLTFLLREKNGRTFGSITASEIIRTLKEKFSIQISKKDFLNFKPLHEKGEFSVEVKVGKNLTTKLQIRIEGSQENSKLSK